MAVKLRDIAYEQAREIVRRAVDDFLVISLSEQPRSLVRKVAEYAVLAGGQDSNKVTAVDFYGLAGARSKVYEFREAALAELEAYGAEANLLRKIIRSASWQA